MTNTNNTKQASDFDNFTYNIAPQFEDGFYGYAVDKDFNTSIIQMYLDCETEEDEKRVDKALRKLRNFHLSMDRGHLKNKAKYSGEEMFKESNFKEFARRQNEKYQTSETSERKDNTENANNRGTVDGTVSGTKKESNFKEFARRQTENANREQPQQMPVRATRAAKVETRPIEAPISLVMAAEEAQKPDNRTDEQKLEGMKDFCDPTDPDGNKARCLMAKAEGMLGKAEYDIMRNAYNKPETYQRLCNLWDYFHRNKPDTWPERPKEI